MAALVAHDAARLTVHAFRTSWRRAAIARRDQEMRLLRIRLECAEDELRRWQRWWTSWEDERAEHVRQQMEEQGQQQKDERVVKARRVHFAVPMEEPFGAGEQPTAPGAGEQPTAPGAGEQPTVPAAAAGEGEQPTAPIGGAGEQPTASGAGEQPTVPTGGAGEQPTAPGAGEQPTAPLAEDPDADIIVDEEEYESLCIMRAQELAELVRNTGRDDVEGLPDPVTRQLVRWGRVLVGMAGRLALDLDVRRVLERVGLRLMAEEQYLRLGRFPESVEQHFVWMWTEVEKEVYSCILLCEVESSGEEV